MNYKKRIREESINKILKYASDPNILDIHMSGIAEEAIAIRTEIKNKFLELCNK